ncbi:MAG: N-acetyl-gamma-glutamyl-phosphate reductase [Clostridiales Family XIII bacterium]|jgi:N-acetyl-gamma-glutamyl-phosphate reductase|nr:N-acetyl-gamma-glutamyl-phosphate reductase [Clostridiales Family XIII bacterium]
MNSLSESEKSKTAYGVFIDGRAGTTGLRIEAYLSSRDDIRLIDIDESKRKDTSARLAKIEEADIAFLCLPDGDARAIVAALDAKAREDGPDSNAAKARVIDASTAHRTDSGWVYGLPELAPGQRARIAGANRVAMAGCHAAGFILLARPLVDAGLAPKDYPFAAFSLTGYSGGGKRMIAEYEDSASGHGGPTPDSGEPAAAARGNGDPSLAAPRQYALGQGHKHLPEMTLMAGIEKPPVFSPVVADYYAGMEVAVPLHTDILARPRVTRQDIWKALEERYAGEPFVTVMPEGAENEGVEPGFLSASAMAGRNDVEIYVTGNDDRVLLIARYDNLGKGASGSGVQCMNLMLGLPEERGLKRR